MIKASWLHKITFPHLFEGVAMSKEYSSTSLGCVPGRLGTEYLLPKSYLCKEEQKSVQLIRDTNWTMGGMVPSQGCDILVKNVTCEWNLILRKRMIKIALTNNVTSWSTTSLHPHNHLSLSSIITSLHPSSAIITSLHPL